MKKQFNNPLPNAHTKQLTISFPDVEDTVCANLKAGHLWSTELGQIASRFIRPDSNVLDVGAHIGTFSTLAASLTKGKVYSIEPDPANFAFIQENKGNNGFAHMVPLNCAAGNENGFIDFCVAGPGGHVAAEGWGNEKVQVPVNKLDDIVSERVDFIKLDVEGFEIEAIAGMRRILERDSPPLLVEFNGYTLCQFGKTPNDLTCVLEELGYRVLVAREQLIPINQYEPFPYGVVDCLVVKDYHLQMVRDILGFPLSGYQRRHLMEESNFYGNSDMKRYFSWYRNKINF